MKIRQTLTSDNPRFFGSSATGASTLDGALPLALGELPLAVADGIVTSGEPAWAFSSRTGT